MSQRVESIRRLELYQELDDIVSAMKNMAQVELQRLMRAETIQQAAFTTTLSALGYLEQQFSEVLAEQPGRSVLIVFGSERGFCGGFNEQVVRAFREQAGTPDAIMVMGSRLAYKLQDSRGVTTLPGPAMAAEVLPCAQQLIEWLLQRPLPAQLTLLSHGPHGVAYDVLLPVPELPPNQPPHSLQVHLPPVDLRTELQWQYLQQGLIHSLLVSLKTENRLRLQQMEGAREHLEELTHALRLRLNALRQQEIVEEIEIILADQGAWDQQFSE
jgi:F-type H+-transporting ATPase subunit gamma